MRENPDMQCCGRLEAIFCDIDGTIVTHPGFTPDALEELALLSSRGITPVLITGRDESFRHVIDYISSREPTILNVAHFYFRNGSYLYQRGRDPENVVGEAALFSGEEIVSLSSALEKRGFQVYRREKYNIKFRSSAALCIDDALLIAGHVSNVKVASHGNYVAYPRGVSKLSALRHFCNRRDINEADVVVLADSFTSDANDAELAECAGKVFNVGQSVDNPSLLGVYCGDKKLQGVEASKHLLNIICYMLLP